MGVLVGGTEHGDELVGKGKIYVQCEFKRIRQVSDQSYFPARFFQSSVAKPVQQKAFMVVHG